jgi:PAS domain S-box-containing protein
MGLTQEQPQRNKTLTLGRVVLGVLVLMVGALGWVSQNEYKLDRNRLLDSLQIEIEDTVERVDRRFFQMAGRLDAVADWASIQLKAAETGDTNASLLEQLRYNPQHTYYEISPPTGIEDYQRGNLIGTSKQLTDPQLLKEAGVASRMFSLLYPLFEGDTQLSHCYYVSHNHNFIATYPYQSATEVLTGIDTPTPEIWQHKELHKHLDDNLAVQQPEWYGPWPASNEHGLAVYRLSYVKSGGKLAGTLESEVSLSFIESVLPSKLLPKCQVLMLDREGHIIAASSNCQLEQGQVTHLDDWLPTEEAQKLLFKLTHSPEAATLSLPGYTAQLLPLGSAPWYMVNLVPNQAVAAFLHRQVVFYLLQMSVIALLLAIAFAILHYVYVLPFARAERELQESHAFLEQRVSERTQELEALYEELQATNEELTATNEELAATNQELASANEEIAAANEELNAANEEILATNEELSGAYQQLHSMMEQLRDSEGRLRAIFTHSAIPTIVVTPGMRILEANDAFCEWLGYTQADIPSLRIDDFTFAEDRAYSPEILHEMESGEKNLVTIERRYRCKDGRIVWALVNAATIRDDTGKLQFIVSQGQDVTQRRAAEEALAESNERFFKAFHSSPDSLTITRLDTGEILEVNEGFTVLTGYTAEEAVGNNVEKLNLWSTPANRQDYTRRLKAEGQVRNLEFTFVNKFDYEFSGLISGETFKLGTVECIVSIVRDISDLRRSERQMQRFFSLTSGLMMIADMDGNIVRVNNQWGVMLGCPAEELVGRKYMDFVHPEDANATQGTADTHLEGKTVTHFENRYVGRDGSVHNLVWSCVPSLEDGLIYSIAHDVTELHQALRALRASGEQFRAYFELGLTPMAFIHTDGRWLQVNPRLCELVGYTQDELREQHVMDLLPPNQAGLLLILLNDLVSGKQETISIELVISTKQLDLRKINFAARARRDDAGRVSYILAQLEDITAAKHTEADLRRLTTAIHQAAELIAITNPEGKIEYVNPAFTMLTGFSEQEVLGQGLISLVGFQQDSSIYAGIVRQMRRGEVWHGEITNRAKDGRIFHTETSLTPVSDSQGEIVNFVAIARDVTNQRKMEQQIRQSQKMEAIGTLAGGIAHDFNNILFAILGNTEMALEGIPAGTHAHNCLKEVQVAGQRAKDLIKQILSFARQTEHELGPVMLGSIVKEVAKLMRASLPTTIEIQLQVCTPDAVVIADATQIHQIVMNLLTNAGQAMSEHGGALSIRMDCIIWEPGLQPEVALVAGKYAMLQVRDTGPGIPPEVLPRIFEPFFTTKEKGKGTGMGLAVVHGAVNELGGAITAHSAAGEGALFTVYVPLAERYMDAPLPTDGALPRGHGRILLVDDEETLVNMLRDILASLGYQVTGFANSLEALAEFESDPAAYDLLFTDQTMPKLTGIELAQRCREIRDDLPVVLCTGYSQLTLEDQISNGGINEFVSKPLSKQAIAQVVQRVLARSGGAQMSAAGG